MSFLTGLRLLCYAMLRLAIMCPVPLSSCSTPLMRQRGSPESQCVACGLPVRPESAAGTAARTPDTTGPGAPAPPAAAQAAAQTTPRRYAPSAADGGLDTSEAAPGLAVVSAPEAAASAVPEQPQQAGLGTAAAAGTGLAGRGTRRQQVSRSCQRLSTLPAYQTSFP